MPIHGLALAAGRPCAYLTSESHAQAGRSGAAGSMPNIPPVTTSSSSCESMPSPVIPRTRLWSSTPASTVACSPHREPSARRA